jgi:hypothetical protein
MDWCTMKIKKISILSVFIGICLIFGCASSPRVVSGNCTNGDGTLVYPDGMTYVGHFKNKKKDGQGTQTRLNGITYVGQFKNDQFNGLGSLTTTDPEKAKYEGEFLNGKKHGHGILISLDGQKYDGQFVDDNPEGYGTVTYSNGSKYVGSFEKGQKFGQGIYTYSDGSKLEGEFRGEDLSGIGKLTYPDGFYYNGTFEYGQKSPWVAKVLYSIRNTVSISRKEIGKAIVGYTHPTADKAKLEFCSVDVDGGIVNVYFKCKFNGGFSGTKYHSKLKWSFSEKQNFGIIMVEDDTVTGIEQDQFEKLKNYFQVAVYPTVLANAGEN